jgi:glycosyltransferase involved in cell wall biosynthesis
VTLDTHALTVDSGQSAIDARRRTARVAVFTDNDFSKVNGVTTTLKALLRYAPADVQPRIYTLSDIGTDVPDYLALRAWGMPIPYYSEMSIYAPRIAAFRRQLEADRIDVIHLTTPGPVGLSARYLASRAKLHLVGSFHTHLADYARRLSGSELAATAMRHYLRWVYGTCTRVMVPSEDARRRLIDDRWPADRLTAWTRGVDVRTFRPERRSNSLREQWRVCERRPALLYVGRLSREKDLGILPSLLSALHARQCHYRLIVVGGGPMLPELRAACGDAVFTGTLTHDEVAVAMASADLFVFPSTTDTAGNVVLEAQAAGLPVIVSDRGGPSENMINGESGIVCRAGDPSSFAAAIQELSDPVRRVRADAAARRYAESRSWEESLRPVYTLYRAAHAGAAASNVRLSSPHRAQMDPRGSC